MRALLGDANDDAGDTSEGDANDAGETGDRRARGSPADALATSQRVLSPEFATLVAEAQQFLMTSGMPRARLATLVGIPATYASRLARGEPFPCSRAVADRIRARIREY